MAGRVAEAAGAPSEGVWRPRDCSFYRVFSLLVATSSHHARPSASGGYAARAGEVRQSSLAACSHSPCRDAGRGVPSGGG